MESTESKYQRLLKLLSEIKTNSKKLDSDICFLEVINDRLECLLKSFDAYGMHNVTTTEESIETNEIENEDNRKRIKMKKEYTDEMMSQLCKDAHLEMQYSTTLKIVKLFSKSHPLTAKEIESETNESMFDILTVLNMLTRAGVLHKKDLEYWLIE
ncbi:hypothetical protein A0H76_899 [Hepatospora eriocheir]|uniref:Uncharacterized protein n=1 Tax=Hepatospora eriocheir TaxID=1081669 RepID=A0A1X0QI94_9MICR|nr:hypothetical protein A0H76_899 [Hepatospora eriocheir]